MKKHRLLILLICSLLIASPVFGATVLKKISVELNSYIVKINGKALGNDNIVYNGNVYVRADKISTALVKTFKQDSKSKTILINDKATPTPKPTPTPAPILSGYSYSNPAPINTVQTIKKDDLTQIYTIETKITEIVRGDKAWQAIQAANMFNSAPKDGYEYLLVKIYFKVNDITKDQQFNLNGASFTLVSSGGKDYDLTMAVAPDPQLQSNLYKDAFNEGYAIYMVKKDDLTPKLVFGRNYDGSGGIWFKAYTE